MALFEKGHTRLPGAGRQKGRPNNATRNAREAIARLIEGNIDRLQGWLDEIAIKQGALAALRCLLDLLEYHVPKLTRAELTVGKTDGGRTTFDSRLLSPEDRQAAREALERYQEIINRYDAITRDQAASGSDPDTGGDPDESAAASAEGVGDCDER
jgi:predicted metal-dependent phosphoesterase TrpH